MDQELVLRVSPAEMALLQALVALLAAAKLSDPVAVANLADLSVLLDRFLQQHPQTLVKLAERLGELSFPELPTYLTPEL